MVSHLASPSFPDPAYQAGMTCMYDAMHDVMYDDAMYDAMHDAICDAMYDAMYDVHCSSKSSKWGVSCQLTPAQYWRNLSKKGVSG